MPKADQVSPGAVSFLRERVFAHIATVMANGAPQVTPLWIDVEDDGSHVLVNTAENRIKTNNVGRDPRVALSVIDPNDEYRYVIVRGTVVEKISAADGADAHADRMAKKYLNRDVYPFRNPEYPRVILRIRPHHVIESKLTDSGSRQAPGPGGSR